jgi:hypothetical protein
VDIELCNNGKVDIIDAYKSPDKHKKKVDVDKLFAGPSSILLDDWRLNCKSPL